MLDPDDFIIKEGRADKPLGYPPTGIIKKALENLYVSIVGALDLGDFETFLKEVSDLTYDEAKDKMIREYGTVKELSAAGLRAKTKEAEVKLEIAAQEAMSEQRTLEQEFAELDEIARKRLGENLELSRRNEELSTEVERLKKEAAAVPFTALPGAPLPSMPAAAPTAHGSMYQEYRKRISEIITVADINDLAAEIFDVAERAEYDKLTKSDITELMGELRKISERRSMKLAEMKLRPAKIRGMPAAKKEPEEEPPRRKRERREAPVPAMPTGIPQIAYKYTTPERETFVSMGETFLRDFELERTIKINHLLLFPDHWYTLSAWGKRERFGWDMAMAFREAIEQLHKFSWQSLIVDYGIPKEYIDAWRGTKQDYT